VITLDKAGLWVDGRYHIQAPLQVAETGIDVFKQGLADVPTISQWLAEILPAGSQVGFDAAVLPKTVVNSYLQDFNKAAFTLKTDLDLLNNIWADRPKFPAAPIWQHTMQYAGRSSADKITQVRHELTKKGVDALIVSALDDVAWLFNYRGSDAYMIPVAMAFAVITEDNAYVFIDSAKVPLELRKNWLLQGIEVKEYFQISNYLADFKKEKVFIDPSSLNWSLAQVIEKNKLNVVEGRNPVIDIKTIKNSVELTNYRQCLARDGVAVVRFIKWLEEQVPQGSVFEHSAAEKLASFRQQSELYIEPSFTTIPGYAENGALMHYASSPERPVKIGMESFFLVDSGGQYPDGTTDITRTFSFGELNEQMRRDYTLVAKAMINLSMARFMKGTSPCHLDVLARGILWQDGINYGSGTGHGVGICLKVHEAPHNFGMTYVNAPLEPGHVITNEPGIYREGVHGIRIENIMSVVEHCDNEFGTFYRFEALTMAPICTRALDMDLLGKEHREWLNDYHAEVYQQLAPLLNKDEKTWLKKATVAI
ncbi:MAG: aminopeptidase P family protein, partial [Lentisphaeraceae bacterium]|nr:aminopeptidase P family protein [Lentisphaeraceae bacterium]